MQRFDRYPFTAYVTQTGDELVGPDNFAIVIPQNAFSGRTSITVSAPQWNIGAPREQASDGYKVEASATPARNCTVYVPYLSRYEQYRGSLVVYLSENWVSECDPGVWQPTPRVADRQGLMGGSTGAFGMFVVIKPTS